MSRTLACSRVLKQQAVGIRILKLGHLGKVTQNGKDPSVKKITRWQAFDSCDGARVPRTDHSLSG